VNRRAILSAFLAALAMPVLVQAQAWPSRAVRIIVSVPAGSLQDALARTVAQRLSDAYGQPVIVENRPGANTIIAAQAAAKSPADGYTFLIATDSTMSINPHIYSKLPYDPEKDFAPVTAIAQAVEVMFVPAEVPAKSVKEFIDQAKANPGKVNYGSFGIGSNAHLAGVKMEQVTGVQMVHVPYKGGADAIPALQTNQVQMLVTAIGVGMSSIKAGKAKVLAVSGPQRHRLLPDVPTFTEAGYPAFDFSAWFGLVAPAGTPPDIINRVSEEVAKYVKSPAFTEKFATSYALDPIGNSPTEFATLMKASREKYGQTIRAANLKLDTP
jgi:tripartite-type tricarboxylate transporter receptor subunit TctC